MNKVLFGAASTLCLLTSVPAHAEMNKGGSMTPIIWGIFLITAVVPVLIGLLACGLLKLITGKRPKRAATVMAALFSWWIGIHIAMQDRGSSQEFNELWIVIWTTVLSIGMAYLSTVFTEPVEQDE